MSVLPSFELIRAGTLGEALDAIASGAVPYAGGTELLLAMRAGLLRPETLVDLKGIRELSVVERAHNHGFRIGGSATHDSVARNQDIRSALPMLASVLHGVGNPRVRSAGTLGGNLCFAEPKSDVATMLIAMSAEVTLRSTSQERTVPVRDLVVGPYTTVREDDEMLTSITVPPLGDTRIVYEKFQTMERPSVGVATAARPDGSLTLVVGAVGPVPEVFEVSGADADPEEVAASIEVIPDLTGSERYKRHMTAVTVRKTLQALEEAA